MDTDTFQKDDITLEILIHEFLVKKRYVGAAKIFMIEASIPEYNPNPRGLSLLNDWFTAFNEIYNARCGNIKSQENIARIEGVMLKLENEKKRHAVLGRFVSERVNYDSFDRDTIGKDSYETYDRNCYGNEHDHELGSFDKNSYGSYDRNFAKKNENMHSKQESNPYDKQMQESSSYNQNSHNNCYSNDSSFSYNNYKPRNSDQLENNEHSRMYQDKHELGISNSYEQQIPSSVFIDNVRRKSIVENNSELDVHNEFDDFNAQSDEALHNLESKKYSNYQQEYINYDDTYIVNDFLIPLFDFHLHLHKITCTAICYELKLLITGGHDKLLNIINLQTFEKISTFEPHTKAITDIKIKEIICNDKIEAFICTSSQDTEIKLFRYSNRTIEHICTYRGHKTPVTCIEFIGDTILSLDVDGEIRKWNWNGEFEENLQTNGIKTMLKYNETMLLVSDRNKVSLYDYTLNKNVKDLSNESSAIIRKKYNKFLVCHKDKIIVFDENLKKLNIINNLGDKVQSACMLSDSSILIGSYQQIHKHGLRDIANIKAHDNVVGCLESINIFDKEYVISCSYDGDCKVWEYVKVI
ncbi:hypothetical protein COBT_000796 [Conglomerata obtusa]